MKSEKKNISASNRFRAAREQLGFTQQKLADELLLTRNYIAKIEAGIQEPSARAVMALETLRVSLVNKSEHYAPGGASAGRYEVPPGTPRSVEELVRALRGDFEALLGAASQMPQRLHWMAEQMKEHLSIPKTWNVPRAKGVHVTLPSQTVALSAETGKPLPSSRPARSA